MNPDVPQNSAYTRHDSSAKTKRVYFYLVKSNNILEEYFLSDHEDIRWEDMPSFIEEKASDILAGTIPPTNSTPRSRRWFKRSYFVYYDPTGNLLKDNAVTFKAQGSNENKCFFDGADVSRQDGKIYAFYCINHMLRQNGAGGLGPQETEVYALHVNHLGGMVSQDERDKGAVSSADAESFPQAIVTHNDSGTNTGPP